MTIRESGSLEEAARSSAPPMLRPQKSGEIPQQSLRQALIRIAGAATICAVLVVVSVALIDRPVASWVHEHLGYERFAWFTASYGGHLLRFGPFTLMASPAEALQLLAPLIFVVVAISAAAGSPRGVHAQILLALCLSVFAARETNDVLKEIFGRTWPESWLGDNPSWIRDGAFGFFPFHRGAGWELLSLRPYNCDHVGGHHPLAGLA